MFRRFLRRINSSKTTDRVVVTSPTQRRKKALLMGLNYTGTNSALNGCENDVDHIKQYLLKHGYEEKNIKIMTEDSSCFDRPTKRNMINAIKQFSKDSDENTDLFFHYSGHGTYLKDRSIPAVRSRAIDEEDGRDECLCPLDYTRAGMITDDDLRKMLVDPLKKGCNLTALLDCCHSGTALDLQVNYIIDMSNDDKSKFTARKNNRVKPTDANVVMISGCLDNQTSADYYGADPYTNQKEFQGAMTNAFLVTMNDIESKNKNVSYKRVMKGITNVITRQRFTQRPQFSSGYLIDLEKEMIV